MMFDDVVFEYGELFRTEEVADFVVANGASAICMLLVCISFV